MQPLLLDTCRQPPLAHGVVNTGRWRVATGSSAADGGRGESPQLQAEA